MGRYKNRQTVICFKSEDRCGKDTVAELALSYILNNSCHTSDIFTNARDLKKFIAKTLNMSVEELDRYKNNESKLKISLPKHKEELEVRDFIIRTSKALVDNFGSAVIIDKIVKSIFKSELDIVIIPDLRFKIEYKKISSKFNTYVIEIDSNLESCGENGKRYELDKIPTDFSIMNIDGNVGIAKKEIENILSIILDEIETKE